MSARTLGLMLIIAALVVAFTGRSRQETEASARQHPSGQARAR